MSLNIIGISAFYHDSACCLIKDGKLVSAAQEERFTRVKHDASMPQHSFLYCLKEGKLTISDIDCVAFYEIPAKKLARQLWSGVALPTFSNLNPNRFEQELRQILGYEGAILYFDHHLSHAASSFFFSGFESSAILTVDGVGEWATTTYGLGNGNKIDLFEEVHFPDSIGLLYSTITSYLGFKVNDGEYKVMGLAPYGKPLYKEHLKSLIQLGANGQFQLDMKYFDFMSGNGMFSQALGELLGQPARQAETSIAQFHKDVSRSLQVVLEEVLLDKVNYLHRTTKENNLCMAGGVALNCVANGRILREGPFKKLFVQPASNDAGGALGAAALAHVKYDGARPEKKPLEHAYWGPQYDHTEIARLLNATSIKNQNFCNNQDELLEECAKKLSEGKVIGWFQGRMEFGPRALGARSIIADPRDPGMRDRINAMVKKREGFRPFAPVVLEDHMKDHFDLNQPSPFMLETCQVKSLLSLPAITHLDNSARVQTISDETNPLFANLLRKFYKLTGCPILLNTSFNVRGEPIVCTPEDALRCFITTDIDCLVMGDFLLQRSDNNFETLEMIINSFYNSPYSSGIRHDVYTFI